MGTVAVVVVGFGEEPLLGELIDAVLADAAVDELVIVDNGITGGVPNPPPDDGRLQIVNAGENTGFAGGCHLGVAATTAQDLVFCNSDAVPEPGAIGVLASALSDRSVGLTTGLVTLYRDPGTVNSAGNPVHYSGLSWSGGWGEPVSNHLDSREVASVSGAFFATSRAWWEESGGLPKEWFAYGEDVELSLRTWLSGRRVVYVPQAVARHDYRPSRGPQKFYLLERNRLWTLTSALPTRTILRLGPGLAVVEVGIWLTALRQGWWRAKARATVDGLRQRRHIAKLHPKGQVARADLRRLEQQLAVSLDFPSVSGQQVPAWINRLLAGWGNLTLARPAADPQDPAKLKR